MDVQSAQLYVLTLKSRPMPVQMKAVDDKPASNIEMARSCVQRLLHDVDSCATGGGEGEGETANCTGKLDENGWLLAGFTAEE